MEKFRYLKFGLGFVLLFIGVKMIVAKWVLVPIRLSLFVVAGLLGASVLASLIRPPRAAGARERGSGGKMGPRTEKKE
jgi:predicted tellurium resistance membrane protein TerC